VDEAFRETEAGWIEGECIRMRFAVWLFGQREVE
jgi:hypothetical protein